MQSKPHFVGLAAALAVTACAGPNGTENHRDATGEELSDTAKLVPGSTSILSLPTSDSGKRALTRTIDLQKDWILRVRTFAIGFAVESHLFDADGTPVRPQSVDAWYGTRENTWRVPAAGTYSIYSNAYFNRVAEDGGAEFELFVTCTGAGCPAPLECPAKADFDDCMENAVEYMEPDNPECYPGSTDARADCLEAAMESMSEGGLDAYIFPCDEGELPTCNHDGYFDWVWDAAADACKAYSQGN